MANIVQYKERGGVRRHESGDFWTLLDTIEDWFNFYKSVDGLRPAWVGINKFVVFRQNTGQVADQFKLEAY